MGKENTTKPLTGAALIKETCRRIRVARSYWDAHNNRACRGEREKALESFNAYLAVAPAAAHAEEARRIVGVLR